MIFESQEQLEERLAYWQKVLRLQDWKVRAEIARERDFGDTGRAAEISPSLRHKSAKIKLLDPIDYTPELTYPGQDHDRNLVHELLHLHFESMDCALYNSDQENSTKIRDSIENDLEIAIELVAQAIVSLDRQEK